MFSLVGLLEGARPVAPVGTDERPALIDAAMQQLRGHVISVPGHASQRYPQSPTVLNPVRAVFEAPSARVSDEVRIPALRELLFRPERVYPEKEGGSSGLATTLLGAFQDPLAEDPLVIALRLVFGERLDAEARYADSDEAAELLQHIYLRTELSARIVLPGPKRAPKLAWIGGSSHEGGAPPDWRERIEASGAIRGLSARIFEQPYRRFDSVRREVHDTRAAAAVVWVPYAGDPSGWARIPGSGGKTLTPIETTEAAFEDALLDATMQLDEGRALDLARADEPDKTAGKAPGPGEVRIYKKEYATPGHDVMLESNDCGHNAWERARKAPKAAKGIARLEPTAEVASLEKCMRCTGGGRWRVTFA
jgi:hypothetical protein